MNYLKGVKQNMYVRPEIQKLAQDLCMEKEANKFRVAMQGLGSLLGKGAVGGSRVARNAATDFSKRLNQAVQASKPALQTAGRAVDRGISRTGQAGIAAAQTAGRAGLATGKAGLRGAAYTAKLPYTVAKDTVKAIPEAVGATASLATPRKTWQYYRDAAQQAGSKWGARGLLRDVAGYAPDQMPSLGFGKFKYKPKSTLGQVGTELASFAWNPRVPSSRVAGGMAARGYGKGQGVGMPLLAGTAATTGYSAGKAGYEGMLNAPLTGDPQIDAAIPAPQRRAINRSFLRSIPNVSWGAIKGNPVDRELAGSLISNMANNMVGKGLDFAKSRDDALGTSIKSFLQNQLIGRGAQLKSDIPTVPTLAALQQLRDSEAFNVDDLKDSGAAKSVQEILSAADPGKGNRMQLARDVGGALVNRAESALDQNLLNRDKQLTQDQVFAQAQDPNIPLDLRLQLLEDYRDKVVPQYQQGIEDIQENYDLNNSGLQELINGNNPGLDNLLSRRSDLQPYVNPAEASVGIAPGVAPDAVGSPEFQSALASSRRF